MMKFLLSPELREKIITIVLGNFVWFTLMILAGSIPLWFKKGRKIVSAIMNKIVSTITNIMKEMVRLLLIPHRIKDLENRVSELERTEHMRIKADYKLSKLKETMEEKFGKVNKHKNELVKYIGDQQDLDSKVFNELIDLIVEKDNDTKKYLSELTEIVSTLLQRATETIIKTPGGGEGIVFYR